MAAENSHPSELEGPWDVVVVGHGAAGLSAALSFLETVPEGSAARVAVLDRADRQHRGGSTACKGDGFDPTRFDGKATVGITPRKSNWAEPLLTPPYEGVPVEANICFTYGGIRVDGTSHVLNSDGRPIPGLWAAGEITGIFYRFYPSGTSVLRCLTFGRIAGRDAAAGFTRACR
jgi:succinate dehydrogenase/fumarate reductase flavoprotein subunit